jgi:hypothetical protein
MPRSNLSVIVVVAAANPRTRWLCGGQAGPVAVAAAFAEGHAQPAAVRTAPASFKSASTKFPASAPGEKRITVPLECVDQPGSTSMVALRIVPPPPPLPETLAVAVPSSAAAAAPGPAAATDTATAAVVVPPYVPGTVNGAPSAWEAVPHLAEVNHHELFPFTTCCTNVTFKLLQATAIHPSILPPAAGLPALFICPFHTCATCGQEFDAFRVRHC